MKCRENGLTGNTKTRKSKKRKSPSFATPRIRARAVEILDAASDPERFWILERLSHGEACVSELVEETGAEMSTISQRLRVLRNAYMVSSRRKGKRIYYFVSDEHITELIQNTLAHAKELFSIEAQEE